MNGPLGPRALKCIERLGERMIPGGEGFPSFRESRCVERVNELAAGAPPQDIKALNLLLSILSFMPEFVLGWLCSAIANAERFPEFLATPFRLLNIALRGLIVTPYFANFLPEDYNGVNPHEVMGFSLHCKL